MAPFGTFGGTAGMTNSGIMTVINGDIGTIATGTSSITGFHDTAGDIYTESIGANVGAVNGTIYTCTNSTDGPDLRGREPGQVRGRHAGAPRCADGLSAAGRHASRARIRAPISAHSPWRLVSTPRRAVRS